MYAAVNAAFANNHGLITAEEADRAGVSARDRRRLVDSGAWIAVRRGVYVDAERWEAADEMTGRRLLCSRAAHLTLAEPHVMSHDSAALMLGLPYLKPDAEFVHVTRPDARGSRLKAGIMRHGARFLPEQVIELDGVRLFDLARTSLDLVREHGYEAGVVAIDAAMQRGVTRAQLEGAFAAMTGWPRSRSVRAALDDADPGAETPGESLTRLLVTELGLGRPRTQFAIRLSTQTAWLDMLLGCHAVEFDGKVKYLSPSEGGVALRPASDIVWEEKQRQTAVCAEGLGMSRVVWADLWGKRRAVTKHRIRQEYAVTVQRFGNRLPDHLLRFADEHPRQSRR